MKVYGVRCTVYAIVSALFTLHPLPFTVVTVWAQTVETGPPENFITGQTISLDLKGVDILDVLKLLSQKSGLNFVAGRNVTGRVTIFANDVDVWEAFELIVDANELAYERRGDIVNVMTARDYELLYGVRFQERTTSKVIALKFAKSVQVSTALNQVKSNIGRVVVDEASNTIILTDTAGRLKEMQDLLAKLDRPTETRIYTLQYAEAEKLKEKVQEYLTAGLGTFSFDPRTNKVVISDLKEVVSKLDRIIRAFDVQDGMVLIDAKLVEVTLDDEYNMGVDWQQLFAGVDAKGRLSFDGLKTDVIKDGAKGAALKLLSAPTGNAEVVIEALQFYGKTETIANPRIAVANNQEAKIHIGKKEAVVSVTTQVPTSGSVVSTPEIEFIDVGKKLSVTPSIKSDGHIKLKVRPEISTADPKTFTTSEKVTQTIPIVTTTEAETTIIVKSGSTVIIGGLIDSTRKRERNQLPFLGDLPVLGAPFRSHLKADKKTETVIFLTPQIISSTGEAITEFSAEPEVEAIGAVGEGPPVSQRYQAVVRALVSSRLNQRLRELSVKSGVIKLSFVLGKDGRLIGRPEIVSPDGESFVQAAQEALTALTPLPSFPQEAWAEHVRFRMVVDYRPDYVDLRLE